ncbi:2Fe-2S iron-sulfur cluster-binding protein [Acidipila sp. EB88]|uniref:2Fe-2S iron-sulfur cluster-binding protein n=1 Tax=Acidipila sp. EB88 TaxID=2305226 RepID=UPI001F1D70A4|nr:2Fe-2S iron-sulfur cluster-binding protein [Acidipila sp. EB88]
MQIYLNGMPRQVARGTSVAAALLLHAVPCRESVKGTPRAALCGMGICFECRAVINGVAHRRTCQINCLDEMRVETQR